MRVVYFGTAELSAALLEVVLSHAECTVVGVVSKPDKPQGRQRVLMATPLKKTAERHGCQLFQPAKASDPSFIASLRELKPDLFIVVAYGELLRDELLAVPLFGTINLHFSLLPAYRGAAPMQRALMDGVTESGVSVIGLVREMDAGPIYGMRSVEIPLAMTTGELSERLRSIGGELLLEVVHSLQAGTAVAVEQNHTLATYAPKLTVEECSLDWSHSAMSLHNLVRAANPSPGAWGLLSLWGTKEKKRVKFWKTNLIGEELFSASKLPLRRELHSGDLFIFQEKSLAVACGEGALELLEVQPEGKRVISGREFLCGLSDLSRLRFICEK